MEVSADMHLSHLVKAIKHKDPSIDIYGLAGHFCADQGVRIISDITNCGTIGFIEPFKHIPVLVYHYLMVKRMLVNDRPDVFIVVDGQGFNMPLATFAKKLKIPVVYYIPPQEWQWGTEAGGRKVLESVDIILAIFKEEAAFYNKLGGKAYFNGHPLLDIVRSSVPKEEFFNRNGLDISRPLVGLFPGSRRQELKYLLPVMLDTIALLKKEHPEMQCIISAATPDCEKRIHRHNPEIKVLLNSNYDIMAHSDLIITATGTATLETACLLKPMIAVYKFSPVSYRIIKTLVGHKVPKYIALPNIWLDKMAIPEFIQQGVDARNLADHAIRFFKDPSVGQQMVTDLKKLMTILGEKGSLSKNAQIVLDLLK